MMADMRCMATAWVAAQWMCGGCGRSLIRFSGENCCSYPQPDGFFGVGKEFGKHSLKLAIFCCPAEMFEDC